VLRSWNRRFFAVGLALWLELAPTLLGVLAGRSLDSRRAAGHVFVWIFDALGMLWGWFSATRMLARAGQPRRL
jgi:hypothetical protein